MKKLVPILMVAALIVPAIASPTSVSGNPLTDGWAFGGRSLDSGVYVRGDGGLDFDIYSNGFTLDAGSNLLGGGWQVGDSVLGIGGVVNAVTTNLSQSIRIVSKFGTSSTAWTTGSSFSGGDGGDGSILLATYSPTVGTGHLNPTVGGYLGAPGTIYDIPLAQRLESGSVVSLDSSIAKLIYNFDSYNILASWQIILNLSLLPDYSGGVPDLGYGAIQTLQRSNNSTLFTDGLITLSAPGAVVPLPGAVILSSIGIGLVSWFRKRKAL